MLLPSSVFSMMMEGGQVGRQRGGEVGLGRGDTNLIYRKWRRREGREEERACLWFK